VTSFEKSPAPTKPATTRSCRVSRCAFARGCEPLTPACPNELVERVGSLDELRDLSSSGTAAFGESSGPARLSKRAAQVLPVNYCDGRGRTPLDDWGAGSVDSLGVRITSMNAVERPDRVLILVEIETKIRFRPIERECHAIEARRSPLEEQDSFDAISHRLLPRRYLRTASTSLNSTEPA